MAVELALTPDSLADLATADFAAAAGEAGFTAVGLAASSATTAVVPVLERAGVRCHDVLALIVSDDIERTAAGAERIAEAASSVGAPWVLAVFLSPMSDELAAAVERAAQIIGDGGASLGVEFSPLG